jgi:photosystem II stability/assembly factor-like uncharacterized protein
MKKIIWSLILSLLVLNAYSQGYKEMISTGRYSFKQIQDVASAHFQIKGTGKGTGYKQYKRWEYNAQRMLDDNGYVTSNIAMIEELNRYNAIQNNSARNSSSVSSSWESMGPKALTIGGGHNPGIGRITSIAIDDYDGDHIIVGARTGGVWRTTDKGANWAPLCDNFSNMEVTSLAMDPDDSTVYFWGGAMGEIYKSANSGMTWALLSTINPNGGAVNKIIIDPDDSDYMFATVKSGGIYASTDGGVNWTKKTNDGYGFDIEFHPENSYTIYATGSMFHKSTDGGSTWTTTSTGFGSGAKLIAVSPADTNVVYVLEELNTLFGGFYVSSDGGASFTKKSHPGKNYFGYEANASDSSGQAPRDMAIAVSPTNINEVHIGGIISFRSMDGGTSFSATSDWNYTNLATSNLGYCHADIDDMLYRGNELYVVSDGGIYLASNPSGPISTSFYTDKTIGMDIHQFYKIGISQTSPAIISGGAQDNGASVYQGTTWKNWAGGDAMETFVDKNNPNILYGVQQEGDLIKSINGGNTVLDLTDPSTTGNWITPFEQDPTLPNTIYAGYHYVYKSTNGGTSWVTISQNFGADLDHLKIAASNNNYIYASLGANLYRTTTGGGTWATLSGFQGDITTIAIHPSDPNKIAIGTTSSNKVYVSTNGGANWAVKNTALPNFKALALVWQTDGGDGLYLGMNYGIYYMDDLNLPWQNFGNLLPNVKINELEINTANTEIYAATYGRGVWKSQVYTPTVSTETDKINELNELKVSPNPTNSLITLDAEINSKAEIRIFSLNGQLMFVKKVDKLDQLTIDISSYASGVYFVRVNTENNILTQKIVKQ